ncbi:patatin-like phospholipase family protein [Dyadobacter sandarakinus]|uniref:Patatin-like phospholipase family protein n=1 Tax=Dyadobacter sandarakinus TaxID=2747268 RepID=A0ABX7I5V9_9BACT|nr:patatin-like phospholipase family protein [Dyadobacter sandarakinus]QRR01486.1 patatin-like phospholipase family protein [Dyadobacter sandarakinus]
MAQADTQQYNRSLVLAGGGIRLAYHAGVLMALEEAAIEFNHIDGTSGGIFGTAMLASGIRPVEIAKRWRALNLMGFVSFLPFRKYLHISQLPAMASEDGIRKKIFPALGIDIAAINANSAFTATFNVCNFSRKNLESISNNIVTENHLLAGMSLPMFMPAIKIGDYWYTDAVWIKDANMSEAIRQGADEIWLVWCIGNTSEYANGTFRQYVNMIEISANSGLFADLELIKKENENRLEKNLKPIAIYIIKPKYPQELDPDFFFNKVNADTLINRGYADTVRMLQSRKPFSNWDNIPTATSMEEPGISVAFSHEFTGNIYFNNAERPAKVHLNMVIREANGKIETDSSSSIQLSDELVLSGYDNSITCNKSDLHCTMKFKCSGEILNVSLAFERPYLFDMLTGLAFKTAHATLKSENGNTSEYVLTQPIRDRIRNLFYQNVSGASSWLAGMKAKIRLFKIICSH